MKTILIFCIFLITASFAHTQIKSIDLPEKEPVNLEIMAQLDTMVHPETSGIIKSRLYDGVYWVHNDSGHETTIIPINREGEGLNHTDIKPAPDSLLGMR